MTLKNDLRKSLWGLVKSIFAKKIISTILLLTLYISSIIFIFYLSNLWDSSLLKNTLFWFFSFAVITYFGINKADNIDFFKKLIIKSLKWTLIIEYIVNFYTFSLTAEFIIFPILVFVILIQAFSETDKKDHRISTFIKNTLTILGIIYFIYALYLTIVGYKTFFTVHNLYALILPLILTILVQPFLYFAALSMQYEVLYVRTRYLTENDEQNNILKNAIFKTAKLNLSKLSLIKKRINKFDLDNSTDIKTYLKTII